MSAAAAAAAASPPVGAWTTGGAAASSAAASPAPSTSRIAPTASPKFTEASPALAFEVLATSDRARATTLTLPHGEVMTPVYMPVGTQGSVKGLTPEQLQEPPLGCQIILGNTYHLGNYPGPSVLDDMGGLHNFANWPRNLLTDSGGFQMVSLVELSRVTEEGVLFQSPVDGSLMLLTPEKSMEIQNMIGADIMMALDDVVSSRSADAARFREATARTLRWLDRCIGAHKRKHTQNLFGITQGGLDISPGGLREQCLDGMLARDASFPGYAIGGLAGGEDKDIFWRVVSHATRRLPPNKPRYLMGVGYPLDIVVCTALGVDMYDCVYPTRTARFGTAMVSSGLLQLKRAQYATDLRPVDEHCACLACRRYTRAYLHHLFKADVVNAGQVLSMHNIAYLMRLVRGMRTAILEGRFPAFVREYMAAMFPAQDYPRWAVEALADAGIELPGVDYRPGALQPLLREEDMLPIEDKLRLLAERGDASVDNAAEVDDASADAAADAADAEVAVEAAAAEGERGPRAMEE